MAVNLWLETPRSFVHAFKDSLIDEYSTEHSLGLPEDSCSLKEAKLEKVVMRCSSGCLLRGFRVKRDSWASSSRV